MTAKAPKKRLVLLLLLLLLCMVLVWQFQPALDLILPANTISRWITHTLERELPVKTAAGEVELRILPRPAVRIREVLLSDPERGTVWIRAQSLEITLRILPLFHGRLLPGTILLKGPRIRVLRDGEGRWSFMGYPRSPSVQRRGRERGGIPSGFVISAISVREASFEVMDLRRDSREGHLLLQETDAKLSGISGGGPMGLKVKGRFPHGFLERNALSLEGEVVPGASPFSPAEWGFQGELNISHMPAGVSRPFLQEFLGLQLRAGRLDLKGHCSLEPGARLDLSGRMALRDFDMSAAAYFSRPLTGEEALLRFSLQRQEDMVRVRHLALTVGDLSLWGHGIWTADVDGRPWYGVSLHATHVTLEALRPLLPDKILPPHIMQPLERASSQGDLDIPLLEITGGGRPAAGSPPRISWKLAFHDFGWKGSSGFLPLEGVRGEVSFAPPFVTFSDLQGAYGSSRLERLSGTLAVDRNSHTDLEAEARLNLAEIRDLLGRLSLKAGPDLTGVSGYAGIGGRFTSTAGGTLAVEGTVDLIGARIPLFDLALSRLYGRIVFEGERSLPFTLQGVLMGLRTRIQGEIRDPLGRSPALRLSLSAAPGDREYRSSLPTPAGGLEIAGGSPGLMAQIRTAAGRTDLEVRLDLTPSRLTLHPWMVKAREVPAALRIKGRVLADRGLRVEQGVLELAGESVEIAGEIGGGKGGRVGLKIRTGRLDLSPLSGLFPLLAGSVPASRLSANLETSFTPGVPGSLDLTGDLLLSRTVIRPAWGPRAFEEITGTLHFTGKGLEGRSIRCRWGGLPLTLDVEVPRLAGPEPVFRLRIPFVDVEPLVRDIFAGTGSGFSIDREAVSKIRFQADLHVNRVRHGLKELEDLQARLALRQGILTVPAFAASGLGGRAMGEASLDLTAAPGPHFRAETRISDVSAEKYLQLFPHNRTFYAGEISGSIAVEGTLLPDLSETARNMTGSARLRIRSTRERNYLILFARQVIERLQILLGEKDALYRILEYKEMGGDFTIRGGKFHSTNFFIDQYHKFDVSGLTLDKLTAAVPIRIKYNVRAAGSFDFLDSSIDCYLVAEPFSLATRLVRQIPIAGKVLTGEDQSLYSAYFRFQGKTSYKYRGTAEAARLGRIAYEDIPLAYRDRLKEATD